MIRVLDCFAGIAGFTLAGEIINRRIGKEIFKTVGFIEKDEYCQNTLRNLFPGVPLYGDIREVSAEILYRGTDVITGGFPCVDLSKSGKGEGLSGKDSGLFKELLRLSDEFTFINLRPPILVLENVSNLLDGNGEIGLESFSGNWPRDGSMQNGRLYKRNKWDHLIDAKDASLSHGMEIFPTPTATYARGGNKYQIGTNGIRYPTLLGIIGGPLNPAWALWLMGFPISWLKVDSGIENRQESRGWLLGSKTESLHCERSEIRSFRRSRQSL